MAAEKADVLVVMKVPVLQQVIALVPRGRHGAVFVVVEEADQAYTVLFAAQELFTRGLLAGVDVDALVLA